MWQNIQPNLRIPRPPKGPLQHQRFCLRRLRDDLQAETLFEEAPAGAQGRVRAHLRLLWQKVQAFGQPDQPPAAAHGGAPLQVRQVLLDRARQQQLHPSQEETQRALSQRKPGILVYWLCTSLILFVGKSSE